MSIIKNRKKDRPFVILDRACIQDERLSWRARGLLNYLLSLPSDWIVNVRDLVNRAPDGRDAVYSIINELKKVGYIRYEQHRHADGILANADYHVFEVPEEITDNIDDAIDDSATKTEENGLIPEQPNVLIPETEIPEAKKPNTYIINNIQNKQDIKETAAAVLFNKGVFSKTGKCRNKHNKINNHHIDHKSMSFSRKDLVISNKLTVYQRRRVDALAEHLIHHVPYFSLAEFTKQIAETIINQQYFTRCERDFHRKLHVIRRMIRAGGWTPPIESTVLTLQSMQEQLNQDNPFL